MATRSRGFTLLEVMVAMAIAGFAIVALLQLSAQGLRLLKLSGEHQEAVLLADRLAREVEPTGEETGAGADGPFTWERRVTLVQVAAELTGPAGTTPVLYSITVAVRWAANRTVEIATLKAAAPASITAPAGGLTPTPRDRRVPETG
ncbi:MAG TPA: prepilin-type N-terminal cleavage/methylation domain-containing protein [Candidatus Limnocylindrales bacterium]|nr:prepilin-type N-terminal cleavage/methylation domain-containing protein [Candidatus Limnocylindrales bacterium]